MPRRAYGRTSGCDGAPAPRVEKPSSIRGNGDGRLAETPRQCIARLSKIHRKIAYLPTVPPQMPRTDAKPHHWSSARQRLRGLHCDTGRRMVARIVEPAAGTIRPPGLLLVADDDERWLLPLSRHDAHRPEPSKTLASSRLDVAGSNPVVSRVHGPRQDRLNVSALRRAGVALAAVDGITERYSRARHHGRPPSSRSTRLVVDKGSGRSRQ